MTTYRYTLNTLAGDYIRAGLGIVCAGAPLLFMSVAPVMVWILGGGTLLFALFGVRTVIKHATTFDLDSEGIVARGPFGASIPWSDLERVTLRYFSTRKDREKGWMQLVLRGRGKSIRVDSAMDGFHDIVERAGRVALSRGIALDPPTIANLRAAGVPVGGTA